MSRRLSHEYNKGEGASILDDFEIVYKWFY